MSHWDAVVIGGGPAGALTARGLALRGVSTLVLERAEWPRWKVCGACVGPAARAVLRLAGLGALGRDPAGAPAGPAPITEMVLHARGRRARLRPEGWAAWSRASLDGLLLEQAARAGAVCRTGTVARIGPVVGDRRLVFARRGGREETVEASIVIDAAGLGGAGASGGPRGPIGRAEPRADSRIGLGALYPATASDVSAGSLHMVVRPEGYVGLVRLEDGTLDVAAAVDPARLRDARPAEVVGDLLAGPGPTLEGGPLRDWKGTPPLTRAAAHAAEERLFRVGDALAYVEPFTGEGIGWALAGAHDLAPLAVRAVERWDVGFERAWARNRGRVTPRAHRRCRVTARALRHDRLMGAAVRVLARAPSLARPWLRNARRT